MRDYLKRYFLKDLIEQYPEFTPAQLKKLRSTYNNIKQRCGKVKGYEDVRCEWQRLTDFLDFVRLEIDYGRDFREIEKPNIARIFDTGNYSSTNCHIITSKQNAREAHCTQLEIYDSRADRVFHYMHGIRDLWKVNKDIFPSISTVYRAAHDGREIPIFTDEGEFFIKINIVNA